MAEVLLGPAARAPGTYSTTFVGLARRQYGMYVLLTGEMAAGATLDLQLYQAQNANGRRTKVIGHKSIRQLRQASGDRNDACLIKVEPYDLDVNGEYSHVSARLTVAGAECECTLLPLFGKGKCDLVSVSNWTEVVD